MVNLYSSCCCSSWPNSQFGWPLFILFYTPLQLADTMWLQTKQKLAKESPNPLYIKSCGLRLLCHSSCQSWRILTCKQRCWALLSSKPLCGGSAVGLCSVMVHFICSQVEKMDESLVITAVGRCGERNSLQIRIIFSVYPSRIDAGILWTLCLIAAISKCLPTLAARV